MKRLIPDFRMALANMATSAVLLVILNCCTVSAQSASELLEKGIYTEETKGDIDAAIQIYNEIVVDSKTARSAAAQAQYRLGICYHKKRQFVQAEAAFRKVVADFPEQTELAAKAKQYIPSDLPLEPVPWKTGEIMLLELKFPSGYKIGGMACTANQIDVEGKKAWQVGMRSVVGVQASSRVNVDPDRFRPISSRWKHTLIGDVHAEYKPGRVELVDLLKGKNQSIDLNDVVYDNEQAVHLMRRLPLSVGYRITLPILTTLGGGTTIPIGLEVTGVEKVIVPLGEFECFKVELDIKQTFWFSANEHRYLVKMDAGDAIAELTKVYHQQPGELSRFDDSQSGLSMSAPPDWLFFVKHPSDQDRETSVFLSDPEAAAMTELELFPLDTLGAEEKSSLRTWAEKSLERLAKRYKKFQVRPDGWQEFQVDGHPAIRVVVDVANDKKQVAYGTLIQSQTQPARLLSIISAEQFEGHKKNIDAIVSSIRLK